MLLDIGEAARLLGISRAKLHEGPAKHGEPVVVMVAGWASLVRVIACLERSIVDQSSQPLNLERDSGCLSPSCK